MLLFPASLPHFTARTAVSIFSFGEWQSVHRPVKQWLGV